jgi:hypothetical protein
MLLSAVRVVDLFFNFVDRIAAAQYELINSYLLAGSRAMSLSSTRTRAAAADDRAVLSRQTTLSDAESGSTQVAVSADRIQVRAYELYEERGHRPGDALDDWYRAEVEVRAAESRATRP